MNRKECKEMLDKVEKHKELMEWYADGGDVEASLFGEYYYEIAPNPTFDLTFNYRKRLNIHQDVKDLIEKQTKNKGNVVFKVTPQESKEFQTYLFEKDLSWPGGFCDVRHTDKPYLKVWGDTGITFTCTPSEKVYKINEPILSETDKKIKELEDKIKELKQIREDDKNG